MVYTNFNNDNALGSRGEKIFENEFLKKFNIEYRNVSFNQAYRKKEIDYITANSAYEIKTNYKDDGIIIVEEYHNIDEQFDTIKKGWWYQTKADYVVFISRNTGDMIFLPMQAHTRNLYEEAKENYPLIKNKVSYNPNNKNDNTNKWQGAFRSIPLSVFQDSPKALVANNEIDNIDSYLRNSLSNEELLSHFNSPEIKEINEMFN